MSIIPAADFDWDNDPDIIIKKRPAMAVFLNNAGLIVIRQERAWDDDTDVFIMVRPEDAKCLSEAILRASRERVEPVSDEAKGSGAQAPSLFPSLGE